MSGVRLMAAISAATKTSVLEAVLAADLPGEERQSAHERAAPRPPADQ